MGTSDSRVKAGLLVSIFIRAAVLLRLPDLLLSFAQNAGYLWDFAVTQGRGPVPVSLGAAVWPVLEASLAQLLGLALVFGFAGRLGDWIAGPGTEFTFNGDLGAWQQAILQFVGITLVLGGLAGSGAILYENLKAARLNQLNGLPNLAPVAPKVLVPAVALAVKVVAGAALLAYPAPLARWMGRRRQADGKRGRT